MKLSQILTILIILFLYGCATKGVSSRTRSDNKSIATFQQNILDVIEQAVDEAFQNIDKNSPIAIVSFATSTETMSETLLSILEHTLVVKNFTTIIDRIELDKIRAEQNLSLSGDVDDQTAIRVGKITGATLIVTGNIDAMGLIRLRVLNSETAVLAGSALIPLPPDINISLPHQTYIPPTMSPIQPITPQPSLTIPQIKPLTPSTIPPTTNNVSDIIIFGKYEWRILDIQGNRALIITTRSIAQRKYHNSIRSTTWEKCDIRKWLNGDFFSSFSTQERSRIAITENGNPDNSLYRLSGGGNTFDYIFLLSFQEAERYFNDDADRKVVNISGRPSWWYLRSPGDFGLGASGVSNEGSIYLGGFHINDAFGGIRPALWLQL